MDFNFRLDVQCFLWSVYYIGILYYVGPGPLFQILGCNYDSFNITTSGHTNVYSYCCARFGQGSGPIYLDHVYCTGRESSLLDCIQDDEIGNVASYCSHSNDIGVRCPCKDFV